MELLYTGQVNKAVGVLRGLTKWAVIKFAGTSMFLAESVGARPGTYWFVAYRIWAQLALTNLLVED